MTETVNSWNPYQVRRPSHQRRGLPAAVESQDRRAGRAIEVFHFAFLEVALTYLRPADFALKGGGNLRLFLRSRRRSRDLDLDFLGTGFAHVGDRVDAVLASRTLATLLKARGIDLIDPRRSKDTNTVKRWKLALATAGMEAAPTKVEFFAQRSDTQPILERSDPDLARRVKARAILLNHYAPVHAIEQQVQTLAERGETQPRDLFDLDHLFREYPAELGRAMLEPSVIRAAVSRAWELTYDEYQALVVEYLEEDVVALYEPKPAWDDMQLAVVTRLEARLQEPARKDEAR